jgi:hypothetical protein
MNKTAMQQLKEKIQVVIGDGGALMHYRIIKAQKLNSSANCSMVFEALKKKKKKCEARE